jgi:GDPmannose 4,6-dehydratase
MMWMILQAEQAEDWVIATGKTTTVRDFIKMCFKHIGVELEFRGQGVEEKGYVKSSTHKSISIEIGKEVIAVDPKYFRPTEVDLLIGDASKAKNKLGWTPKYDLKYLVNDMMSSDLKLMQKQQYLKKGGYAIKNYYE